MKKTQFNSYMFRTLAILGLASTLIVSSCRKKDDPDNSQPTAQLKLDLNGLEDLGSDYAYEGWLIVDGKPVSAGVFTVDADGNPSSTSFTVNADDLSKATTYVLTIEPSPDNDPAPSDVHVLAGDFSNNTAQITVSHSAALGTDFNSASGGFILATPTDGNNTMDELSGVWWVDPTAGPAATLTLPTLPAGWQYEGWAVVDGQPVSTGKFTSATGPDDFSGYSGTAASAPPFPGEDLLMNAPNGLTFPTDLSEKPIVISVEPMPDNSAAPFAIKPLVGTTPAVTIPHTVYNMNNQASTNNPTGTVTR